MRSYPCYLLSRESGNLYRFDEPGYRCEVIKTRAGSLYTIGEKVSLGYHSDLTGFWTEVYYEQSYDPTQQGDQDDDI